MKTLVISILIFATFIIPANAQENGKKKTKEVKIKTSSVCNMCKESIERAMAFEKGVKNSSLDVPSQVLTVVYKPEKTDIEKIKKAISMAGYDADDMPADEKAYEKLNPCCRKEMGVH